MGIKRKYLRWPRSPRWLEVSEEFMPPPAAVATGGIVFWSCPRGEPLKDLKFPATEGSGGYHSSLRNGTAGKPSLL
jgi:hypothetical protein